MNEQEFQYAKQKVVELSQDIIDGRIGIIEGSRRINDCRYKLQLENDQDFLTVTGIDSETDHMPLGEVRKLWSPDALIEKDKEISENEKYYRPYAIAAAKNILKKFSDNT